MGLLIRNALPFMAGVEGLKWFQTWQVRRCMHVRVRVRACVRACGCVRVRVREGGREGGCSLSCAPFLSFALCVCLYYDASSAKALLTTGDSLLFATCNHCGICKVFGAVVTWKA